MAKSLETLMQEELGQLHFQLVVQAAQILKLQEENEQLKIVREPDNKPKPLTLEKGAK